MVILLSSFVSNEIGLPVGEVGNIVLVLEFILLLDTDVDDDEDDDVLSIVTRCCGEVRLDTGLLFIITLLEGDTGEYTTGLTGGVDIGIDVGGGGGIVAKKAFEDAILVTKDLLFVLSNQTLTIKQNLLLYY